MRNIYLSSGITKVENTTKVFVFKCKFPKTTFIVAVKSGHLINWSSGRRNQSSSAEVSEPGIWDLDQKFRNDCLALNA